MMRPVSNASTIANSLELGESIFKKRRRRRRARTLCKSLLVLLAAIAVVSLCGELYRHEVKAIVDRIKNVMSERESLCLSSVHVGRDDYRIIVVTDQNTGEVFHMINPSIYQVILPSSLSSLRFQRRRGAV